jgi:hypothetical protein
VREFPSLFFTYHAQRMDEGSNPCLADALCRRPGPAIAKRDREALAALRLTPVRLTQSSTSLEVED